MLPQQKSEMSFYIVLLIAFIDHMGIGLVYPLFAALLFDPSAEILSPDTSLATRGLVLGVLIALTPFAQFFSSPLLGSLSDSQGRKKILMLSITIGIISYTLAIFGIMLKSLALLFFYRFLQGISDGSVAVAQAALVDMSTKENKPRRFSLFQMALGAGFTMGPFIGGKLSDPTVALWCNYAAPFYFSGILCLINLVLVVWRFSETNIQKRLVEFKILDSLHNIGRALGWKELRIMFLATFIFTFGWSFFIEFIPIFLMDKHNFTSSHIGNFFAVVGISYAVSSGLFTTPLLKKWSTHKIFSISLLVAGIYLPLLLIIENSLYLWLYIPFLLFLLALIYPAGTTLVSDSAPKDQQGEALGIFGSVNAFAMMTSPFAAGSLVAGYPSLAVWGGSAAMIGAGCVYLIGSWQRRRRRLPTI